MTDLLDPRGTVISQYANSPVLLALIDQLGEALGRGALFDAFFDKVWNIETATGFGLDIWGRIVGVSRSLYVAGGTFLGFSTASPDVTPFGTGVFFGGTALVPNYSLTDLAYRKLILAKAAFNITNCSPPAINAILRAIFPGYGNVYVRDNLDMTITYVFGSRLTNLDYAIVTQSGVVPRPCGVAVSVEQP